MRDPHDSVRAHAGITVILSLLLGFVLAAVFLLFVAMRQASFRGWDDFGVLLAAALLATAVVPLAILASLLAPWIAGEAARGRRPVVYGFVYGAVVGAAALVGVVLLGLGVLSVPLVAAVAVLGVLGGWLIRKAALALGAL